MNKSNLPFRTLIRMRTGVRHHVNDAMLTLECLRATSSSAAFCSLHRRRSK